uniref:SP-RING-type domain-containing protein n=1 Tax=Coccidioides posadasii RMSCC 3488 TaxID=454284 RepID=A0A0J6F7G2_COCPO|nr:hypothetical protein CPAG_01581 [Coccidioides posadasii RMSCC 3488]
MAAATPSHRSSRRQRLESDIGAETPSGVDQALTLPRYQRQSHKLNADAKIALLNLAQSEHFRYLDLHLQHLASALANTTGEINDQLTDAKARYERQKRKRGQKEGSEDVDVDGDGGRSSTLDDAEEKHFADLELRVNMTTKKMEEKVRELVDTEMKAGTIKEILEKMGHPQEEGRSGTQRARAPRTRRRRLEDEDEDGDDADVDYNPSREEDDEEGDEVVPASELYEIRLKEKEAEWESRSLTQRYTTHNTYIGFYRMLHDSKHPGDDIPPLPHPSTWFSNMELPEASESSIRTRESRKSATARRPDDDIAIESERVSIRCPITLLPFKDPVTSAKCPHSFERAAIESMINCSSETVVVRAPGLSRGRQKLKFVKCPVCSAQLLLQDLRQDPVLLRRVRRAMETAAAEEEEEAEADTMEEDDQDVVMHDLETKRSQVRVKVERAESLARERSMIPGTQFETVQDDDGEEEEDDEG